MKVLLKPEKLVESITNKTRTNSIYFTIAKCLLGYLLVAFSGKGICAIYMGDDPSALSRELEDKFSLYGLLPGHDTEAAARIMELILQPGYELDLPLDIQGTVFQKRVWQALREIPAGATASYSDIAKRIGRPKSVRAVARACAANQLALAIPCHRIIRNDGALSGYRWGVARKQILLNQEKQAAMV